MGIFSTDTIDASPNYDTEKASFIYLKNKEIYRFMYIKMSPKQLKEALPITYKDNKDKKLSNSNI